MTPQDTMRLALEALETCTGVYEQEFDAVKVDEAIEALRSALAQQPDADPNAPWMTEAHHLCSDHGIPHGNITERIRALRDKLSQQVEQQPVAWRVWRGDAYELYFDHAAAARRGECFVPHRQPEPLFAGAAPNAEPC